MGDARRCLGRMDHLLDAPRLKRDDAARDSQIPARLLGGFVILGSSVFATSAHPPSLAGRLASTGGIRTHRVMVLGSNLGVLVWWKLERS